MQHILCLGPGCPRCLPCSGTPQALLHLRLGQQSVKRTSPACCEINVCGWPQAGSAAVQWLGKVRWGRWCVPRADRCYIWNARLFSPPLPTIGRIGKGTADITVISVCVVICCPCCTKVKQHGQDKETQGNGVFNHPPTKQQPSPQFSCPWREEWRN